MDLDNLEKKFDEYMTKREEIAWSKVEQRLLPSDIKLANTFKELIKNAFLVGYSLGSIDEEVVIKELSKVDPIQFYNWLKE